MRVRESNRALNPRTAAVGITQITGRSRKNFRAEQGFQQHRRLEVLRYSRLEICATRFAENEGESVRAVKTLPSIF